MYADVSFQNLKLTRAETFSDLVSTPLMLHFDSSEHYRSYGKVCFHLENPALAKALVKAINETLKAFEPVIPELESDLAEEPKDA